MMRDIPCTDRKSTSTNLAIAAVHQAGVGMHNLQSWMLDDGAMWPDGMGH
jgi:hypothetical protein